MKRQLLSLILAMCWTAPGFAQERLPIIDMHLHAGIDSEMRLGLCVPWVTQFPPWDPKDGPWADVWMGAMTEPPCADPIWSPASAQAVMEETIAVMERRNIFGVLSGSASTVPRWLEAAPGRFIPSLEFNITRDGTSPAAVRRHFESGDFLVFGEISNQYAGIAPNDPRMEPYWELAEQLDVPVAIHMGDGTVGTAHLGFPGMNAYRARLTSPYLLEDVLVRHPKLRVSVMHLAFPLIDELIALLAAHPQVYADIGGIQWFYPRPFFYEQLRRIVNAGFGKRVMFGSDQGDWAGVIEPSIAIIEEAPFLSETQKRDILYNNAARFLRLSKEEIARHHGR
jgi:predicted TIM-barrel fold metal-dependent hydrolase